MDNFIAGVMGHKEGRRYLPYAGTLFLYIMCMNFMGMVPGMKSPTSSLNTTVAPGPLHLYLCAIYRDKTAGNAGILRPYGRKPQDA